MKLCVNTLWKFPQLYIGKKILKKLWYVALVAYIRFAAVYKKFGDKD
jgi:transcriptional regulator NrdR family protein